MVSPPILSTVCRGSWKVPGDRGLGREGEDDRAVLACGFAHHGKPECLAQRDECRRAKGEYSRDGIHDEMVMKNGKRSEILKLAGNGKLAAGHRAIDENELHAYTIGGRRVGKPWIARELRAFT